MLERFKQPDDRLATRAVSLGVQIKSYAPDTRLARTRIPRMTESSFSFSRTSKPYLLENRIAVLRLAAEILCLLEGTKGIDSGRRKTIDGLLNNGRLTIDETLPQKPTLRQRLWQ
jgi:hypothetical protein